MSAELGQPGQIIDGKYRIVRLLGSGGMGAVFEGENIRIRRKVAIKMLHGSVSTQDDVVKRFENEAKAAGMVGSEHICEVLDMGMLPDQTRYMVMEYLDGDTLSGLIKRMGRLRPPQSIPIISQVLDALGAAHQAGIIHRDLKPDNVFILPQKGGIQNFVKILDFGVSKFSQLSGESMNVTRAGAVVGTPYYMSPEQARGSSAIDARTDVYAIGVLLYQATTGQVPYQAETFNELLFKIVLEVAPPPQTYVPDIDPEFAAIIQRAMAREPDQRFQSCQHFKGALVQFQNTRLNALPAYALPSFNDPMPVRTEIMDLNSIPGGAAALGLRPSPSGASWPAAQPPQAPPGEGTMPMQPGLPMARSGAGAASPMQSGAGWAAVSNPGAIPVGPGGPTATSNAWGNASSHSNATIRRPGSGKGMVFGVVTVAALAGVGVAVAAVMAMKQPKSPATQPSTTPSTTAVATDTPTEGAVAPTAAATTAAPTETAAPTAAATGVPTATAVATATTAPTATAAATAPTATTTAPVRIPGPMPTAPRPTGAGTSTPPKPGGATTAKPGTKPGAKSGGNDLGY